MTRNGVVSRFGFPFSRWVMLLALPLAVAVDVHGAEIVKADNTTNLNLGASWVGDVPPGSGDVAVWDSTVTTANTSDLGTNLALGGIKVLNPGGAIGMGAVTLNAGSVLASNATDSFTYSGADVINGAVVSFTNSSGGSIPGGLVAQQVYVIVNVDTGNKTFQIADTEGGSPINFTSNGSNLYQFARPAMTLGGSGINLSGASQNLSFFTAPVLLSTNQTWTVGSGRTLDSNNNGNFSGLAVLNHGHTLTFDGAGTIDMGQIHGTGGVVKGGSGRLNLHAGNYTFTGDVVLNAGTLNAGSTLGALGSGASALTLNGGTLTFLANGARNYARNTTIGGSISISNNNSSGNGAQNYTFGTLSVGAHTVTVTASGSNEGNIIFGATTLTGSPVFDVGSRTNNQLQLGAISESGGSHGFTKQGVGTMILSNACSYTGATLLQRGVLKLAGAASISASTSIVVNSDLDVTGVTGGTWALASGQVLSGTGTVLGTAAVDGSVAPGDGGIGALRASNVTWNSGSAWRFELGAASEADRLVCSGSFLKGSGTDFVFDLQSTGAAGVYTLVTWAVSSDFDGANFSAANVPSGLTADFTKQANDLTVTLASGGGPVTNNVVFTTALVSGGVASIQWTGSPGTTSLVEGATALGESPAADWTAITSVVLDGAGQGSFSETNGPATRFYRVWDQAP